LKNSLKFDSNISCVNTKELLFLYEVCSGQNITVSYDEKNRKCLKSEHKQRLGFPKDLNLFCIPYSCRFCISKEKINIPPPLLPGGYKFSSMKNLFSFSCESWNWKVDLTESSALNKQHEKIYGIEFKFDETTIQMSRRSSKAEIHSICVQFWDFAVRFLNLLYKSNNSHFDKSLNLIQVTDKEKILDLREQCLIWMNDMKDSDDFPGSMPVNLSKKDIDNIKKSDYFVSEKTDGIRSMLMILHEGVFLIDRKFEFYLIPGFEMLVEIFAKKGITLLDGEMVTHRTTGKQMYLIFDLLVLDSEQYTKEKLYIRLDIIGKRFIQVYRESLEKGLIPQIHPFILIGKQFSKISEPKNLKLLFGSIKKIDGQRYYQDKKRYHKTDGFIFTPNKPYSPKTCHDLYKWKYLDEHSVDLKISFDKAIQDLNYFCVDNTGRDLKLNINLQRSDNDRLIRFMSTQKNPNLIIELCCLDISKNLWKFKMIRTDKARANHIRVVENTEAVLKENIGEEELKFLIFSNSQ